MTHNVPEGVAYGTVHGEFMSFAADRAGTAAGPDGVPDKIPMEGYVVLTPQVETVRWPSLVPPITAVIQDVRCPLIEGKLYPPGTTPESAASVTPGVVLVATEQPEALPSTVQYTLTFDLKGIKRQPNPVTFEVPSGGVVDLTTVIPATPVPGTVVVVSAVERERAEAAAEQAEGFSDAAQGHASAAQGYATAAEGYATTASQAAGQAEAAQAATQAAAIHELRGTGMPNGVVTADPGTYYTDTAGTNGAWRWLKTSGTGSAGWTVVHGDTGWRRIFEASEVPADWQSGSLDIRRRGSTVTLRFNTLQVTPGTGASKTTAMLTNGFQLTPTTTRDGAWLVSTTDGQPHKVIIYNPTLWYMGSLADLTMAFTRGNTRLRGSISWETDDAWPTTLPGTPA